MKDLVTTAGKEPAIEKNSANDETNNSFPDVLPG
jgi:hypothetical protein